MYVEFLPFLPFENTFEYYCEFDVQIGDVVRCRFGAFDTLGTIINIHKTPQTSHKLSSVKELIYQQVFSAKMLEFIGKMSNYYGYEKGLFAKLTFPFNIKDSIFQTSQQMVRLTLDAKLESSKAQKWKEVFNTLKNTDGLPASLFTGLSQFKSRGLLEFFHESLNIQNSQSQKIINAQIPSLSKEQEQICTQITEKNSQFKAHLIFGKTGSGKTEVYVHLIQNLIKEKPDAQILLMLPEIGLAKVISQRLEERFGIKIPVWNSAVADGIKKKHYQEISAGACNVVIGTRSALFLPYKNLQMIIVDEEHDFSYKQEESPIYNARDGAVMQAKIFDIPVILGSATPSIESFNNAKLEKYTMHELNARFNSVLMPKIEIVREKAKGILCETLKQSILKHYTEGKQVLVFLNRRGFAPINECKACKGTFRCDSCDSFLTYHKKKAILMCHKCTTSYAIYNGCTMCNAELEIVSSGSGVEAVYEEITNFLMENDGNFNKKSVKIFSSDEQNTEKKLEEFIADVKSGETKVIIGTQIASKGYDFPNLKLVCIVDLLLKNDDIDFKADEKLMQLLVQVSGRSGRSGEQGLVLIQTKRNEEALKKIINTQEFYDNEILVRKQNFLPPFSRFIAVIFLGKNEKFVQIEASKIAKEIQNQTKCTVLGPAPSAIAFIRNVFRYRVLIISNKQDTALQKKIQTILKTTKCRTKIDVDAINFY